MFLYAEGEINWTAGGETHAQAGFDAGDRTTHYSLPASQTAQIVNIDNEPGNTRENGFWMFRVDQEEIVTGFCTNDGKFKLDIKSTFSAKFKA